MSSPHEIPRQIKAANLPWERLRNTDSKLSFHEIITRARGQYWPPDELLLQLAHEPLGRVDLNSTAPEATVEDIAHAKKIQFDLISTVLPRGKDSFSSIGLATDDYQMILDQYRTATDPHMKLRILRDADAAVMLPIYPLSEGFIQVAPALLHLENNSIKSKIKEYMDTVPMSRFYLNPHTRDVPDIARSLLNESEDSDIVFYFKFADAFEPETYTISDKVLIYTPLPEAPEVFDIIRKVKRKSSHSFDRRQLPKLAYPLEDGIGYAEDPPNGYSYTNSRSLLLRRARELAGGDTLRIIEDYDKIFLLRLAIKEVATTDQINPRNIAFNS